MTKKIKWTSTADKLPDKSGDLVFIRSPKSKRGYKVAAYIRGLNMRHGFEVQNKKHTFVPIENVKWTYRLNLTDYLYQMGLE